MLLTATARRHLTRRALYVTAWCHLEVAPAGCVFCACLWWHRLQLHTLQLQCPSVVVYWSLELGYVGGFELLSPLTAYSLASFLFPGQHLHSDRAQCDAFLLMYLPLSWHQGPIQPSGQAAGSKSEQRSAWQHIGTHVQHHAAPCVAPCGAHASSASLLRRLEVNLAPDV